jgi:hypothetical protein
MRAKNSTDYCHPQLDDAFPPNVVTFVLRKQHEQAFEQWLNLGLEEQYKQLAEFFSAMWTEGQPRLPDAVREALVPGSASEAERALFLVDLDCTLDVMELRGE